MKEITTKLGNDGRIVIPAVYRQQLHFEPGEELLLRVKDNELRIFSVKQSLANARKGVQHYSKGTSLVKKLEALRKEDRESE